MKFFMLILASVFWLSGTALFAQQCQPSADVSLLCNAALSQTTVTTSSSYVAPAAPVYVPPASVPVYVPPTYSIPSSGIVYRQYYRQAALDFPVNHAYYRTPVASFDFNRSFAPTRFLGPPVYAGGGVHTIPSGAIRRQPPVVIVNNLPAQRQGGGGGGLVRGIGGAVSNVIDAVGRVANSPAGLVAIGAGIGGAGPLAFFGGGGGPRGGNGLNTALNFQAAQNKGLSPQAAAVFAASQKGGQGRGRGR